MCRSPVEECINKTGEKQLRIVLSPLGQLKMWPKVEIDR